MDVFAQKAMARPSQAVKDQNSDKKSGVDNKSEEIAVEAAGTSGEGGKSGVGAAAFPGLKSKAQPQGNFFDLLAAAVSSIKTEQGKDQDFQEYLQMSGIKMAWVRAIVALYEEPKKPDDPLSYILKLMGLGIPEVTDVQIMQERIKFLRVKLLQVQSENERLMELVRLDDEAQEQNVQTQELVSLFDDSKYFSEYISDDDQEYESQSVGPRPSEADSKKHGGAT